MQPQLAEAFADGSLVRPIWDQPDLVHLVRAVGSLCGATGLDGSLVVRELMNLIGPAEHYVFALLDGMGMNLVQRLPADSFVVRNLRTQIRATCPSTTAAALTSVATGQWASQHGITGWFTHLPEYGLTATVLPFTERFTQQPLSMRGLDAAAILPLSAFYPQMNRPSLTLLPAPIVNTVYATWSRGYTPGAGYTSIANAIDQIIEHLHRAVAPTHVHLYVPDIDTVCHKRGVTDSAVDELVISIDSQLKRLADAVNPNVKIVVTADHGLIDVPLDHHVPILDGDPLLALLEAPPSGDARLPLFHVKPKRENDFMAMFSERFRPRMVPLTIAEAEEMRLFGPEPLSAISRRRLGTHVGIALRPATLLYHPPVKPPHTPKQPYYAQHAGLSRPEMIIPLVIR